MEDKQNQQNEKDEESFSSREMNQIFLDDSLSPGSSTRVRQYFQELGNHFDFNISIL